MSQVLELVLQFTQKELNVDPDLIKRTIEEKVNQYKGFVRDDELSYLETPTIFHLFLRKDEG